MPNHRHIFFERRWEITNETYYMLGECSAVIRSISKMPIQPFYRRKLQGIALTKGAQATTAIEGNTLDISTVEKIRDGERLAPSHEYLEIEVKNILNAYNTILKDITVRKKTSLITSVFIKDFHRMIGENLNEHFQAIPGQFRKSNVTVANYRPPNHETVSDLIEQLCTWLQKEFHFKKGQTFIETIIQAIVIHIYIAWIHPFADGNGRTARLLEFYLLLRAGVPDIASHILSNHYNTTRSEYYRQITLATKKNELSEFIYYAICGFRDGLNEVLKLIQKNQLGIAWADYVVTVFENTEKLSRLNAVNKRKRTLMRIIAHDTFLSETEIQNSHVEIAKIYAKMSHRTFVRDLEDLVATELLQKKSHKYKANVEILTQYMATSSEL